MAAASDSVSKKSRLDDSSDDSLDLSELLAFTCDVARRAGVLVRTAFAARGSSVTFKGSVDLVTETDEAVEKLVFDAIRSRFPAHALIGEESVAKGASEALGQRATWIVDPVDGTTNFVHGLPWVGISIAFAVAGKVLLGVVYNPILDELFTATLGSGARLNGEVIRASETALLKNALVATGFSYDRREASIDFHLGKLRAVLLACRDIRRPGSAAMDMCAVACGRLDAYYELGIHIWDMAAAALIVREAGGVCCDPYRGDVRVLDLGGRGVLAACGGVAQALATLLQSDTPPVPND
jgi:fructose-1,6-bisphosphatase/inositol monophosphatase family enzyme